MAASHVSEPAICFQIGTPTEDESICHFIGTPTRQGIKLKDEDVDECFECDDSDDDRSRASDDDSDCQSEVDTEASPISSRHTVTSGKKLTWDEVTDRSARICSISPPVAEPQEPNWRLEAACHLAGNKGYAAGLDADRFDDSSDDGSDDDYMGSRRDNLDDDFEIGSLGSDSDDEA